MCVSHLQDPVEILAILAIDLPFNVFKEIMEDSPNTCALGNHVGNLDRVPGPWLNLAHCCIHLGE